MQTVFLKAAFLTAFVFLIGVMVGAWLDTSRLSEIKTLLTDSELLGTDISLQGRLLQIGQPTTETCDAAIDANLAYNDRIYADGQKIEQAEAANRFTPELLFERKRYALQQLTFWANSIALKERCNANYVVVMDVWTYDTSSNPELRLPQRLQSAALLDEKERCGAALMLSNVPVDLGLISVDMTLQSRNVTQVPAIIVNDSRVFYGNEALEFLKSMSC